MTDSLDCFFVYLARHPDHRHQLVEQPDVLPSAIEEMLRWETPVPGVVRVATEDVEVGGCPIGKGERVSPLLGAANTDPAEFPDPELVTSAATRTDIAPSAAARTAASVRTWPAWSCGWRCGNSTGAYRITRSNPVPS